MKKILKIIGIVICMGVLCFTIMFFLVYCGTDGPNFAFKANYTLHSFGLNTMYTYTNEDEEMLKRGDASSVFVFEKECTKEEKLVLYNAYYSLDENVREKFENYGTIHLHEKGEKTEIGDFRYTGETSYLINLYGEINENHSLKHEMTHYVDFYIEKTTGCSPSCSEFWKKMCEDDTFVKIVLMTYSAEMSNEETILKEVFAECYSTSSFVTKLLYPDAYKFTQEQWNSI